jgi:predicted ArsR family transcriptional regulator
VNEIDAQHQARALGDPTRYQIFRYIVDAERPVNVGELTDFIQLNHNAVRQHLAVLKDAELVIDELEDRDRPGRPRLLYRLHPEAAGSWGTGGPYAWLARLLSNAVRRHLDPRQVGRLEGHRRAAALVGSGDAADLVEAEMVQRGFRPVRTERGRRVDFVLERCPFAEVAHDEPDTVCQLHLGLAEGLFEGLGGLTVDRLVAKDARRAGCRLIARRDPPTSSIGGSRHRSSG